MHAQRPVLSQINVVSANLARSVAFYRALGLHIPEEAVWTTATGTHHAAARDDGTGFGGDFAVDSVPFAGFWNVGWKGNNELAGRVVVGFRLPSRSEVDERYDKLTQSGYRGLQPPYDAFWGARYAIVEDPDGVAVGLMSPVDASRSATPPRV